MLETLHPGKARGGYVLHDVREGGEQRLALVLNAVFGTQGLHQRGHLPVVVPRHRRKKAAEKAHGDSMAFVVTSENSWPSSGSKPENAQPPLVPVAISAPSWSLSCHFSHHRNNKEAHSSHSVPCYSYLKWCWCSQALRKVSWSSRSITI